MLLPLPSLLPRPSCCCRGRLDAAAAVVPHPDPAPVSAPRSARSSSCAPSHPPCAICTPPPPVFPYNYPFKPIIVKLSLQSPHYRRHQCESGRFRVGPPSRFSELALRVISPSRSSESPRECVADNPSRPITGLPLRRTRHDSSRPAAATRGGGSSPLSRPPARPPEFPAPPPAGGGGRGGLGPEGGLLRDLGHARRRRAPALFVIVILCHCNIMLLLLLCY